ncbi:ANTAR domain-containing response regulator [Streptomyces sp. NBC_00271]|uniref:ANTAR domain-containing response regulator n=1 Tax=Streptomyces sp. NBC_00271 TaxID=2975697 RepID=UPI002E299E1D|nr:GAF and ANTAR domain-containing protein [Streptomyces sp. NBC_00271]
MVCRRGQHGDRHQWRTRTSSCSWGPGDGPLARTRRDGHDVTPAHRSGFGAVQALPMRLRDETVGALNLFRATPGPFDPAATPLAQALADVATISLLQQGSSRRGTVLNEQLQTALNSRVLIEQAKGKLAERRGIDMEQAFTALRGYARSHNRRLSDVARAFIDDSEPLPGLGA